MAHQQFSESMEASLPTTLSLAVSIMSGAGNLFTVLDARHAIIPREQEHHIARQACEQYGTDGFLVIDASHTHALHFSMRYYNADGSSGSMCGNGGRCAVEFAMKKGLIVSSATTIAFDCIGHTYHAEYLAESYIRLVFPAPMQCDYPRHIVFDDAQYGIIGLTIGYVDVGVEHCVVYYPELGTQTRQSFDVFDIDYYGSILRHHKEFPQGSNVNFYTITGENILKVRTYERGVERETGACGSGAIATALIAMLRHDMMMPTHIVPTSGSVLTISAMPSNDAIDSLSLQGHAEILREERLSVPMNF